MTSNKEPIATHRTLCAVQHSIIHIHMPVHTETSRPLPTVMIVSAFYVSI